MSETPHERSSQFCSCQHIPFTVVSFSGVFNAPLIKTIFLGSFNIAHSILQIVCNLFLGIATPTISKQHRFSQHISTHLIQNHYFSIQPPRSSARPNQPASQVSEPSQPISKPPGRQSSNQRASQHHLNQPARCLCGGRPERLCISLGMRASCLICLCTSEDLYFCSYPFRRKPVRSAAFSFAPPPRLSFKMVFFSFLRGGSSAVLDHDFPFFFSFVRGSSAVLDHDFSFIF